MITIKEIIYLCRAKQLQNCLFIPEDYSRCPIGVDDGVPKFRQVYVQGKCLLDLSEEELNLYEDNVYYFSEYFIEEIKDDEY